MTFQVKDRWNIPVTAVADEFIDQYMAAANGEYVKVYLYLLRHQSEPVSVDAIADALNHTESDVRRALAYWEKAGVLLREDLLSPDGREKAAGTAADRPEAGAVLDREMTGRQQEGFDGGQAGQTAGEQRMAQARRPGQTAGERRSASTRRPAQTPAARRIMDPHRPEQTVGARRTAEPRRPGTRLYPLPSSPRVRFRSLRLQPDGRRAFPLVTAPAAAAPSPKPVYSVAQVNRLSGDEEFAQILYIAQKYMNKVFTPRDCQVFAYLYDTLKFSPELLEYLVEYCVQNGHVSVRYMETVAINWHEQGFRTPDEAKEYVEGFNNDAFSVMKAFGLNDRRPATEEQKMITKWFREYGFGRELVLMACNRTISAIHTPSFRYADKILSDWKLAGVRTKADVEALDEKRSKSRAQGAGGQTQGGRSSGGQGAGQADGGRRKSNQFHNFKQRDTDYDALVLKQLKERVNQQ